MEVRGQHHAPAALLPGKKPVPIEYTAGWPPKTGFTFWRSEKSLAPTTIRTPDIPSHSLFAKPTTQPRLTTSCMIETPSFRAYLWKLRLLCNACSHSVLNFLTSRRRYVFHSQDHSTCMAESLLWMLDQWWRSKESHSLTRSEPWWRFSTAIFAYIVIRFWSTMTAWNYPYSYPPWYGSVKPHDYRKTPLGTVLRIEWSAVLQS
jgi:hypothetical protein